jgi:hypothetical protein
LSLISLLENVFLKSFSKTVLKFHKINRNTAP